MKKENDGKYGSFFNDVIVVCMCVCACVHCNTNLNLLSNSLNGNALPLIGMDSMIETIRLTTFVIYSLGCSTVNLNKIIIEMI